MRTVSPAASVQPRNAPAGLSAALPEHTEEPPAMRRKPVVQVRVQTLRSVPTAAYRPPPAGTTVGPVPGSRAPPRSRRAGTTGSRPATSGARPAHRCPPAPRQATSRLPEAAVADTDEHGVDSGASAAQPSRSVRTYSRALLPTPTYQVSLPDCTTAGAPSSVPPRER